MFGGLPGNDQSKQALSIAPLQLGDKPLNDEFTANSGIGTVLLLVLFGDKSLNDGPHSSRGRLKVLIWHGGASLANRLLTNLPTSPVTPTLGVRREGANEQVSSTPRDSLSPALRPLIGLRA